MLYPVLHRLERDKLISSQWKESGRKRKYYRLLKKGRGVLETERQQWEILHSTLSSLWAIRGCTESFGELSRDVGMNTVSLLRNAAAFA